MKKILTILACFTFTFAAQAQSPKYTDAMTKAIADFDSAKTPDDFLAVSNKFERIAQAEKSQWLPYYYAGFAKVSVAFIQSQSAKDKVDETLTSADALIAKADSLKPNNSEIYVLKAMAASGRIMVDPQSRGMQYGMQSSKFTGQAMQFDTENPRAYLMMGQNLFYTPEAFGGGKEKACQMFLTSKEKYKTFKPESALSPKWGEEMLDVLIQQGSCATVKSTQGGDK